MTTAAKVQKDKPIGSTPRLVPRPTAASAARAARNATNRNLITTNHQKQSPTRAPTASPKERTPIQRVQKSESKIETGILENKLSTNTLQTEPLPQVERDDYIINNYPDIETESVKPNQARDEVDVKLTDSFVSDSEQVIQCDVVNIQGIVDNIENDDHTIKPCLIRFTNNDHLNEPFVVEVEESVPYHDYATQPSDVTAQETKDIAPEKQNPDGGDNEEAIKPNECEIQQKNEYQTEEKIHPTTPMPRSRPQTPRFQSRPQTPRIQSRPTTPAHPHRPTTPYSRPNTPQCFSTPIRSKTLPTNILTSSRTIPAALHSPSHRTSKEDDPKCSFATKQKQFKLMKKELDLKQQAVLELYNNLRGLQERMSREGVSGYGETVQLEELVVFNVADWAADEMSQLCRDAAASSATESVIEIMQCTSPIDENTMIEIGAQVTDVPVRFADLCLQAFTARQEIIDWVKELIEKDEQGGGESLQRIADYNAHGLELCENLHELKSCADTVVGTVTQLSKKVYQERTALVTVGESLVREIARLRQQLDSRSGAVSESQDKSKDIEQSKVLEELRRELEEERTSRVALTDKLATTESQLRQARNRVTKMDRQLREAEASIASLTVTVNSLEDKSRQKEVQLEARARKLKESLKTGEVTKSQLVQQRDALLVDVQNLKQQIEVMTTQHKAAIQELNNYLKDAKLSIEEQCKLTQKEMELRKSLEATAIEKQNVIENLNKKISELENSIPNPDLPTEREIDLWADLQATKDTLRVAEEEVTACKREKVKFLESLTKITESENKVGIQHKLAAELLSKEEILGKMQTQIRELTKNIKLNEQKVAQYEQYVRDLQAHHRAVANCQESPNGISYQDLQQEIMDLRMSLLDTVHRNEEMAEILAQKEQQLDQQDKTSRAQARLIKVREELINMLKSKETEQSSELAALQQDLEHRMKIVDEVNKQIAAKAEEIQELFAILENKQQQIHRLEKIVLALEEQQRRAQAQRTRHEEKIAALEHELAASGVRKEKKFLFF